MGLEIRVNSIEDMCDLMCGNQIPKQKEEIKMTEQKLDEITTRVCDIFRGAKFYDCIFCKGEHCIDCVDSDTVYSLLDIIASLHNELYREVKGRYYDYMFHWANLGYGGSPDDSMFKDKEDEDGIHSEGEA